MMWKVALVSGLACLALMWFVKYQADQIDKLEHEAVTRETAIKTHERIRDADVSRGDPDDDAIWLCQRSGKRDCGS